jgi:amino-acid N-acetyltransferase
MTGLAQTMSAGPVPEAARGLLAAANLPTSDRTLRSTGLGSALVGHVEAHAAKHDVGTLYLLTMTAEDFFARRGYHRIDRTVAPAAIRSTREFAGLCPASSAFMFKRL